jgi:hypothetical protein
MTRPSLKISKRVKHHCCYRLPSRRGRMCRRPIDHYGGPSDYCAQHALVILGDRKSGWKAS